MSLSTTKLLLRNTGMTICLLISAHQISAEELSEPSDTPDPWQGFNRVVFSFNEKMDRFLFKPLAKGYTRIMPNPVEIGVHNVFANIGEVTSTANGMLQGDFGGAAHDAGRLLINTTLGLGGLLDVAQHMNLPADDREDFGQTLAVWGVGQGPYLVLPFFGPSTVRDGIGKPVDWYTDPTNYIEHVPTDNTVKFVSILSARASLFPLEKNITGDRYIFMRDVYLQRREFLINNGEVIDDFGSEDFGMEDIEIDSSTEVGSAQNEQEMVVSDL